MKRLLSLLLVLLLAACAPALAAADASAEAETVGEEASSGESAAHADGEYAPDGFSFSGGSGRVTISCERVTVLGGEAVATIVFDSPNYTAVAVGGLSYDGISTEDSTSFEIPIPLNEDVEIVATTTAMSAPHDVAYTIHISLGEAPASDVPGGLVWTSRLELKYAECFSVDYYEGGYALIDVRDSARYLVVPENAPVPEGLEDGIVVLQQPLDRIYLAATSAMALFDALDALDAIRLVGTDRNGWSIDHAVEAMDAGAILFAGKYSEPDYELLVSEGCDLAIESTMILHSPEVKELIELLGIPVLIDRSSYESHPLGRTEWIKLYAVLVGREAEAEAFFDAQAAVIDELAGFENTEKTVAFFYIGTDGSVVVRSAGDYIARMIEIAGGRYALAGLSDPDSARSSVSVTMEDFYAAAVNADYLIYNAAIDGSVGSVEELLAKSPLFADFKAVKEGNVWCTGKQLYQATDIVGSFITDLHNMLTGREDGMTFLYKLD